MFDSKQIKLIWKVFLSNLNWLNYPYKLNFAITNRCNSRCKTCNIWKKKLANELSLSEIEKIFEKTNFFSWVSLTGGEPFLRKDIVDIVNIVCENCKDLFILNIPTNGLLTTHICKKIEEIVSLDIPLCVVTISLDGPREEHQEIRGVTRAWEKSIETYKQLKEIASENKMLNVFFEFTLSPYNLGLFEKTFNEAKSEIETLNLSDFFITIFHCSHYYHNLHQFKKLVEFRKKIPEEIDKILAFKKDYIRPTTLLPQIYLNLTKNFASKNKTPLNCKALLSSCFLDAYGNLYPCIIYDRKLCNLRDVNYDMKASLNTKLVNDIKKDIREFGCPGCWLPCEANQTILGNILKSLILYRKEGGKLI